MTSESLPLWTTTQRQAWEALDIGPIYLDVNASEQTGTAVLQTRNPQIHKDGQLSTIGIQDCTWDSLQQQVAECKRCSLCHSRRHTVFAAGRPGPSLMIVGEAPGEEEDRTGEPFVGQAGKLLNQMLLAIGVTREGVTREGVTGEGLNREAQVVIANALKCRPPGNRNPSPEELAACTPWLRQQIELVRPKVLFLVGKFAALAVLSEEASISNMRGREFVYRLSDQTEIPVLVSYHPAYYLRRLGEKAKAWEDLLRLKALLEQS